MDPTEIARLVKKLTLSTEANKSSVTLSASAVQASTNRLQRCLVGKIFSAKAQNRETLILQVPKILQIRGTTNIEVVGDNLFVAEFSSLIDRTRILRDGPWHFFNSLMAFQVPQDLQNPSDVIFDDFTVWVQLHNLPFLYMHSSVLSEIAAQIGSVKEIDLGTDGSCMGNFARVRVTRSLKQPLQRCVSASMEDGSTSNLILLLYERLPDFCYVCGRVGHLLRDCDDNSAIKSDLEFGPWLRAGRVDTTRSRPPQLNISRGDKNTRGFASPEGTSSSSTTAKLQLVEEVTGLVRVSSPRPPAEREIDDDPKLSICAADILKVNTTTGSLVSLVDNHVDKTNHVAPNVDAVLEKQATFVMGDKSPMFISSPKTQWKKKAHMTRAESGLIVVGKDITKSPMNTMVMVGGKRGLSKNDGEMMVGVEFSNAKRNKNELGLSITTLATTAETAQQSRRAQ